MSMTFSVDGHAVWQPASGVGRLYMAYLTAVENELSLSAGASAAPGDPQDIQLASASFLPFVQRLRQQYTQSNHGVFRGELAPVLFPAIVMLQRAGHGTPVFSKDADQLDQIAACDASMVIPA
jgi:hypothetical protein